MYNFELFCLLVDMILFSFFLSFPFCVGVLLSFRKRLEVFYPGFDWTWELVVYFFVCIFNGFYFGRLVLVVFGVFCLRFSLPVLRFLVDLTFCGCFS